MLAAGTWTDSAVKTPLYYPPDVLRACATNWSDTTGWSRHSGGAPRDVTDKVAEAKNPRFENDAVVADLYLHGATQKSRDTIELIKRNLISYVSVEHLGEEGLNASTRRLEAKTIRFDGFAFVNRGACSLCRLNGDAATAAPESHVEQQTEKRKLSMTDEEIESKLAEIRATIEDLRAKVDAVTTALNALTEKKPPTESEDRRESEAIRVLRAEIRELQARPQPVVASARSDGEPRNLVLEPAPIFDQRTREISVGGV
jgi:hypothetical protein